MAGIYIHIPFCKTRCAYCDFYSTTQTNLRERYIQALCRELELRNGYLQGHPVHTVYFGGGTPSQLRPTDLERIFGLLYKVYGLEQCTEITLEANPDDLTDDYVAALARLPFNRVSMGIQTFHDPTLRLLNRRHTAAQAVAAVNRLRRAGIRNISIDLIYGLPGETQERWEADLRQALSLDVEHISAYLLTYEEGTPLYRMKQQGQVQEADEDSCLCFFTTLMDTLAANGYEHYEISNFCKPGFHSRHNSSYWQGTPYLGCGPSAHSYNGQTRSWNTPSIDRYLAGIDSGQPASDTERLSLHTRYNEYIMTRLRTRQGASLNTLRQDFGQSLTDYCLHAAAQHLAANRLETTNDYLRLTRQGIFVSDDILSDLMYV